jgi:hypothetical protein
VNLDPARPLDAGGLGDGSRGEFTLQKHLKIDILAGHKWLTPAILATQKAEIRRITVQSLPRQIVHETLSRKNHHIKGLVEWLKL